MPPHLKTMKLKMFKRKAMCGDYLAVTSTLAIPSRNQSSSGGPHHHGPSPWSIRVMKIVISTMNTYQTIINDILLSF